MFVSHPPKIIYKYPAVEYIPLYPRLLAGGVLMFTDCSNGAPGIRIADSAAAWQEISGQYGINPDCPVNFTTDFVVLILHCAVKECKYRDRQVNIVALAAPGSFQVFSLTKRHFYQSSLEFILFYPDGTRLTKSRRYF